MAILNSNNPGDPLLQQAPEPLPAPILPDNYTAPTASPNLISTIPVGAQVMAAANAAPAPVAASAPPVPAPAAPAAPPPVAQVTPQRFTKLDPSTVIPMDPTPAQQATASGSGIQMVPAGTKIVLDAPPPQPMTYAQAAGQALMRGVGKSLSDVADVAHPFTPDGGYKTYSTPVTVTNPATGDTTTMPMNAAPPPDAVDQVINGPFWRGNLKDTIGGEGVRLASNLGEMAPQTAMGIAGMAAGGYVGGPVGALVGGAAGFGSGAALQTIVPAYRQGIADNLTQDQAVDAAVKKTLVAGGIGTLMGLAPGLKVFGKSWQLAGVGDDGIGEMVNLARKPVTEALVQMGVIQPSLGAVQQTADNIIDNKPTTLADLGSGAARNVEIGAVSSGIHAAGSMMFPETKPVDNPMQSAPGSGGGARPEPPIYDADVVQPTPKLPPPGGDGQTTQPMGGDGSPPAAPGQPAYGAPLVDMMQRPQVDVPLNRDDLAAAINNGTPLPTKKTISLPDTNIDPELQAQGYTVGNKVQQITDDGEVHEGTVTAARTGDDGTEVTMLDSAGNLRTLFSTDGPITAPAVPPAVSQPQPPAANVSGNPLWPNNQPKPLPAANLEAGLPSNTPSPSPATKPQPSNIYAEMDLPALKNSLDFVNAHGKQNGWNKASTTTKKLITNELNTRFPAWDKLSNNANIPEMLGNTGVASSNNTSNISKGPPVTVQGNGRLNVPSDHSLDGGSFDPSRFKSPPNIPIFDAYDRANRNDIKSLLSKGFGSLDVPSKLRVLHSMFRSADDLKVLRPVIMSIPVDVMNNLMGGKFSPDDALHNGAVFINSFAANAGLPVLAHAINSAVHSPAFPIAEVFGKSGAAFVARYAATAESTSKDNLHGTETNQGKDINQEEKDTTAKVKKNIDDLIKIAQKDGNLAADKAFQRKRKNLSPSEAEEVRKGFADAYREKGLANAPKTEISESKRISAPRKIYGDGADSVYFDPNKSSRQNLQDIPNDVFKDAELGMLEAFENYTSDVKNNVDGILKKNGYEIHMTDDSRQSQSQYWYVDKIGVNGDENSEIKVRFSDHGDNHPAGTDLRVFWGEYPNSIASQILKKLGILNEAKPAPVTEETKPAPQQPEHAAETAKNEPPQQPATVKTYDKLEIMPEKGFHHVVKLMNKSREWVNSLKPYQRSYLEETMRRIGGFGGRPANYIGNTAPDAEKALQSMKNIVAEYDRKEGAENGAVQQGAVQAGISDHAGGGETAPVTKDDEGQNASGTPQGEDGQSGGGVSARDSVPDAGAQDGRGAGTQDGGRDGLQRDDGVAGKPVDQSDAIYKLAERGHAWTSHTPEKRAESIRKEYEADIATVDKFFSENKNIENNSEEVKGRITRLYESWLQAKSRTASPMITGPAKFNVAQNNKRLDSEGKRLQELLDYMNSWQKRAMKPLEREAARPENAVSSLRDALQKAKEYHADLKANPSKRSHSFSLQYALNAVKDAEQRLAKMEKRVEAQSSPETSPEVSHGKLRVLENVAADRIQLFFEGKPPQEIISLLKRAAFRWSPTNSAWQGNLNNNYRGKVKELLKNDAFKAYIGENEPNHEPPKKKTVTVAGKERPDPNGATLQSLRHMDRAVSKEFIDDKNMSDEHFAELEKYARNVQEEIENRLIEKNGGKPSDAMYSIARKDLTNTPAFKKWFGKSKVVDADGKPLVVYHGTGANFDTFNTGSEMGAHFGTKEQADSRSEGQEEQKLLPVYLSIKKPIRLQDHGDFGTERVVPQLIDLGILLEDADYNEESDIKNILEDKGYDGIVYLNRREALENESQEYDGYPDHDFKIVFPNAQDSYIAFHANQIKSADNKGTFDDNDHRFMYSLGNKAADRLQSTLLKTANAMRQGKGTGDQILGYLRKQAGVKEEEIAWTGLDDFLKGKTGVTKEDVVNYLNENQVRVEEHTLGDGENEDESGMEEDGHGTFTVYGTDGEPVQKGLTQDEAEIALNDMDRDTDSSGAKFSQYALPSGENYREVLLMLPEKLEDKIPVKYEAREIIGRDEKPYRVYKGDNGSHVAKFRTMDEAKSYADGLNAKRIEEARGKTQLSADNFKSSHFDQLNVIAHVRLNDRTGSDGKKVLFVEEIQSDLHQKGRKQGYKTPETQAAYDAAQKDVAKLTDNFANLKNTLEMQHPKTPLYERLHADILENRRQYAAAIDKLNEARSAIGGVPNFPFKKSWPEMAFRRVAQMAAQGGYDRVAWTTGDQQNDRFDLSHHVDSITLRDKGNGLWKISGYKDGSRVIEHSDIATDKLPDYIGKDATDKLMAKPNDAFNERELHGVELKVGGEGMKGFYDKIIPQYASKFGKKFGAEVGKTTLPVEYHNGEYDYTGPVPTREQINEVHAVSKGRGMELTSPITGKKMQFTLTRVAVENPLRKIVKRMDAGESFKEAFAKEGTPEIAEIFGGEAPLAQKAENLNVHSMDITPSMKESADAGFELFKQKDANLPATQETVRAGDIQDAINEQMKKQGYTDANVKLFSSPEETGIAGMDAGAEGAYHNGIIHISMDAADPLKVLDHETIHELKAAGAFTAGEWKTLEERAGEWRKKYKIDENYAEHDLSDRQLNEEGIAHAFQDHDVQWQIRRIINRVLRFFKAIGDFLRGKGFNFKSAEDIFDSVKSGEVSKRESAQRGREEIKNRDAAKSTDTTEENFPKYNLGKSKGPALDEANESLSKVRGLDRTLIKDISDLVAETIHPQQIASLWKGFTPVYMAKKVEGEQREVLIHDLSKLIKPYNMLKDKSNVDAALEIGRLDGKTFKTGNDGSITVKNNGLENTVKSKNGDSISLTHQESAAYAGVRDMMDTALDKINETIIQEAALLDKGVKTAQDVEKLRDAAMKTGDVDQVKRLSKTLQDLNDVDSAKKKGYIPFKRWGEIGISVKNAEDELVHFERVAISKSDRKKGYIGESKAVQKAIERIIQKYPADKYDTNSFEMSNFGDVKAHIDLRNLDILAASSGMDASEYAPLREMLEQEQQKKGFRSHFFKAKDLPGYSDDFERAINDYIPSITGYISRRLNSSKIEDAVAAIAQSGQANLHKYAKNWVDYLNTPEHKALVNLRKVVFHWRIAGNVKSGIVNSVQPIIMTAPWFSAKFSNVEIGRTMTRAYGQAIGMLKPKNILGNDRFNFDKAPSDVKEALVKAYNEGKLMPLGTNDVQGISNTPQHLRGFAKAKKGFDNTLGAPFSIPEQLNRVSTFISGYRLAMKPGAQQKIRDFIKNDQYGRAMLAGKNTPQAFAAAYAELAVTSTNFTMGKMNRPQIARGYGSLMFQFLSYEMQHLEAMYKLAKVTGGKNYKAIASVILGIIAIAGLKGVPFEDDTEKAIEALYKLMTGTDLDIDTKIRATVIKYTHSPLLAEALMKGIPAALLDMDLSGSVGFGGIASQVGGAGLGPWADILFHNPEQAAKDISNGRYLQGAADVAPNYLKNPLTGYQWATDGVRTKEGKKIINPSNISETDVAMKSLGITPSAISDKRDEVYAEEGANNAANDLRTSYYNRLAQYEAQSDRLASAGDKEGAAQIEAKIDAVYDDIDHHNDTSPDNEFIKIDRKALTSKYNQEMEGADAVQGKKQARDQIDEIKQIYKTGN